MTVFTGVRNSTGASTGEVPLANQFGVLALNWYGSVTTGMVLGDTVTLGKVPANAYIIDAFIAVDDLDAGGTPTVSFDYGLTGSTTLFLGSSTTAQAGGIARTTKQGMSGLQVTADTQVLVTCSVSAQSAAAGKFRSTVLYTLNPG